MIIDAPDKAAWQSPERKTRMRVTQLVRERIWNSEREHARSQCYNKEKIGKGCFLKW
jgi:hypothetical protein